MFPAERAAPLLTGLDGHPHPLAFLAGINRVPARHLGVTAFGQSGDLGDVYRHHQLDTDGIIAAGLDLLLTVRPRRERSLGPAWAQRTMRSISCSHSAPS